MDQTPPVGQFENFYSSQTPPWVIDEPPPAVVALADADRQRYVRQPRPRHPVRSPHARPGPLGEVIGTRVDEPAHLPRVRRV
ncbi:hypothetical protein EB72_19930 [Mycobacterium sp. SWH-M1]|nr:hypothetical protein EB72_19930 [Mycobacterium sp. SWH-M1]